MSRFHTMFGRVDRGRPEILIPNVREPYTREGEGFAGLGRSTFSVTTVRGFQKRQTPCYGGLTDRVGRSIFSPGWMSEDRLVYCASHVKHSPPSACLVGETTRRQSLNLDRGGGPLGAQRVARKREPQRGDP